MPEESGAVVSIQSLVSILQIKLYAKNACCDNYGSIITFFSFADNIFLISMNGLSTSLCSAYAARMVKVQNMRNINDA